jgi:hypothetical protein
VEEERGRLERTPRTNEAMNRNGKGRPEGRRAMLFF